MNQFILVGKVIDKTEMKESSSGVKYLNFVLEVKKNFQNNSEEEFEHYRIVMFNQLAEKMEETLKANMLVGVKGRLNANNIENQDKSVYYHNDLTCERITFLTSKA